MCQAIEEELSKEEYSASIIKSLESIIQSLSATNAMPGVPADRLLGLEKYLQRLKIRAACAAQPDACR